ncbi:glycosyltransferase [Bradyrhizobium sp. LHD-71]|uniref:glycosyltransferase n=1 Tax=Bradyrhizobium sp. LHD-71 TaxID=3072141 RepID=UPI00280D0D88|nr:glycosyltransferase [Bradyrhizobium sp. LHD-71]MDQ8726748.1 glycosyltransferase [Bradyrhizobium sp. LHD-71]
MNQFPIASETFIMNTAAGLIDAGHDVDLYGLFGKSSSTVGHNLVEQRGLASRAFLPHFSESKVVRRWLEAPGAFARIAQASGIRAATSGLNLRAHRRRGLAMRAIHEVESFQARGQYDALHCQFGTLAKPVLRHRRAGGLSGPVIVHFRGYDISSHIVKAGPHYYDQAFGEAEAFIANSAFFRDRAIALGCPADKITVVESPINMEIFPFAPRMLQPGQPIRILTVGRLVEKKGIAYAIEAIGLLRARGFSIEHRIVGEGPQRQELEALIGALDLGQIVTLLGERSQEAIAAELAQAHLFLAPSVHAANGAADAAINTIKEAMASGLPVVSTRHGGIPELVEHGVSGLLAPERDAAALADHLHALIRAPESWPRFAAAGRTAVESRFDTAFIARKILDIYAIAAERYRSRSATLGVPRWTYWMKPRSP